jgi:hypothetical protein
MASCDATGRQDSQTLQRRVLRMLHEHVICILGKGGNHSRSFWARFDNFFEMSGKFDPEKL